MYLCIWEDVDKLTDRYHDSGGVVIVAETLERARELLGVPYCTSIFHGYEDHDECNPKYMKSRSDCAAMTKAPDAFYALLGKHSEHVVIFENSGCC